MTGARPSTELSSHFQKVGDCLLLALAETRRILEPELASLAAERGTDEELTEIDGLVGKWKKKIKLDEVLASEVHKETK
jgi:DNA-binding FadR family transcriptional regulator